MKKGRKEIKLMHGSQTFKNSSCKVNVFAARGDKTDKRDFPNKVMTQIKGSHLNIAAAKDGGSDNGSWHTSRFEAEEGKVILIIASTTFHGRPYSNGCMIAVLRDKAPLVTINALPLSNCNATFDHLPAFIGRADVLTAKEAKGYGVSFNRYFVSNNFDEEELGELFEVSELSPGTKRPKMITVKTPGGSIKKVMADTENKRRIRIRR